MINPHTTKPDDNGDRRDEWSADIDAAPSDEHRRPCYLSAGHGDGRPSAQQGIARRIGKLAADEEDMIVETTPDGVDFSIGIGLNPKAVVTLHVSNGESDIYAFIPPRIAFQLAAELIGKTISTKMPNRIVRAYRIMRGKNV